MSGSTEIISGSWAAGSDPQLLRGPRPLALWIVEQALESRQPADRLRALVEGHLDGRDRALLHQLVTGVLRWLLRLDDAIVAVGGKPIRNIDPRLLGPLRLGAFQILFLDRIPTHAAVDSSVELAKSRSGAGAGFVNALLRKIGAHGSVDRLPVREKSPVRRLAIETSHPPYLVERWLRFFGEERTRGLLEANNRNRPSVLLAVGGEERRGALVETLAADGVVVRLSSLSPVGLVVESGKPLATRAYREGELYPQDEASQCAAVVPLPEPAERVLDALAAPGGKTLSLLAREPGLQIVDTDRGVGRLRLLLENRRRTGRSFSVVAMDAGRSALTGTFDRVIADLPCTGTGTLRKHPELKWRVRPSEIERLTGEADRLLEGLAPHVAEGGLLVVSTCSIEPEENEDRVARFLSHQPRFAPVDLAGRVDRSIASGIEGVGRWRLLPGGDHDGFTVHVLRRIGV